jgi:hypothetical protein
VSNRLLSAVLAVCTTIACGAKPADIVALDQCSNVDVTGSRVVVRSVEIAMHDVAFRVGCNGTTGSGPRPTQRHQSRSCDGSMCAISLAYGRSGRLLMTTSRALTALVLFAGVFLPATAPAQYFGRNKVQYLSLRPCGLGLHHRLLGR